MIPTTCYGGNKNLCFAAQVPQKRQSEQWQRPVHSEPNPEYYIVAPSRKIQINIDRSSSSPQTLNDADDQQ